MSELNRRQFCQILGAGAASSLLWPHLSLAETIASPGRKMNVLFLAVDDLRPQLGCYGDGQIKSPNIDRLAREGHVFQRAYCQEAICAPSRSSVLSGCRPDTTKIYGLTQPLRQMMPDVRTLPEHFRLNGYETISIGKIYHHRSDDKQGWSKEPYAMKGQWQGRGYLVPENIERMNAYAAEVEKKGGKPSGLGPAYEAADVADSAYPDGMDADAAIAELERMADPAAGGKPFFLALGLHKPHLPFNAPQRYWDLYDPAEIRLPDNPLPPEGITPYSLTDWGELRSYLDIPKKGPLPDDLARRLIHGYFACVSYVDAQIGRVLATLDHLKLSDNTVVMLWGDHGWKLGEHGGWSKHTNFELDAHAPLIVRAPGVGKPGSQTAALVEFVDMYPSLCELCGLPQPEHLEGRSFVPVLRDPKRRWKQAAFSQYPRPQRVMGYTMRTDRYRYTEWQRRDDGQVLARELYDHQADAAENRNVASRPENAELVKALGEQLARGWRGALP